MQVTAQFQIDNLDRLSARLLEIESGALVGIVFDDPNDKRPFQEGVKEAAAKEGHEVVEWDRSQL